jgi:Arc/MetJ-type ribon-helix-helix transcriptional regulator
MKRTRISVEITETDRQRIEATVKREYPKLKNVSDVVRTALKVFLEEEVAKDG